ncbi:MAG: putative glycosyltransferase involved in cell wall biosis [Bacteroidota bacterium]|nr:putative glycosyltransferase involved in cell wall biosis [Bacteroidota bacterium]
MAFVSSLKQLARTTLSPLLYTFYYIPNQRKISVTRDGQPLKPGITAVVAAKDEEYTIAMCLESLVGIADQVVCIDNGSTDGTLAIMKKFKGDFGNKLEVDILEMPGALLGDCREAGLKHTRHEWHLRWDADMICKTSWPEDMKQLRQKYLSSARPQAVQLPRTNLLGDLHHTYSQQEQVVDPGEPILVRFGRDIIYKEYGQFDTIRVPLYYKQVKETARYYFHLSGLKSANNLLHRWFYFEWRGRVNKYVNQGLPVPEEIGNFEKVKKLFAKEVLGTEEGQSIKFRFLRQFTARLGKYDANKFGAYPDIVLKEISKGESRFEVTYKNGRPYLRTDKMDKDFIQYQPSDEDLNWDVEAYFKRWE